MAEERRYSINKGTLKGLVIGATVLSVAAGSVGFVLGLNVDYSFRTPNTPILSPVPDMNGDDIQELRIDYEDGTFTHYCGFYDSRNELHYTIPGIVCDPVVELVDSTANQT